MKTVTLYTTDLCRHCSNAKALLTARAIEYDEVNLSRSPEDRAALAARTGLMTFPQILIGEEPLGGFTDLLEADRSGRLEELLAA